MPKKRGLQFKTGADAADEALERDRDQVLKLQNRKRALKRTSEILGKHDVVVQKLINKARDDLVWEQVRPDHHFGGL